MSAVITDLYLIFVSWVVFVFMRQMVYYMVFVQEDVLSFYAAVFFFVKCWEAQIALQIMEVRIEGLRFVCVEKVVVGYIKYGWSIIVCVGTEECICKFTDDLLVQNSVFIWSLEDFLVAGRGMDRVFIFSVDYEYDFFMCWENAGG